MREALRFDSSMLMPGGAMALIVIVPSLKLGRNSPPIQRIDATESATSMAKTTRIGVLCRNVNLTR